MKYDCKPWKYPKLTSLSMDTNFIVEKHCAFI
jgi:hypothetical protein